MIHCSFVQFVMCLCVLWCSKLVYCSVCAWFCQETLEMAVEYTATFLRFVSWEISWTSGNLFYSFWKFLESIKNFPSVNTVKAIQVTNSPMFVKIRVFSFFVYCRTDYNGCSLVVVVVFGSLLVYLGCLRCIASVCVFICIDSDSKLVIIRCTNKTQSLTPPKIPTQKEHPM